MNEHANDYVKEWLGAYLDGELSADRRGWVEEHLATCPACQQELLQLRALTELLHADPAPAPFLEQEAFSRQVLKQLPRPVQPAWQRAFRLGLRFTPLGLFGVWAFFQAVIWVSSALLYAVRLFPQAGSVLEVLAPAWSDRGYSLMGGGLLGRALIWSGLDALSVQIGGAIWFGPLTLINLALLALLAVLFFAWLAGLYSHHRAQAGETTLEKA
jgi:predicted anti-sigma-YlaC factor YlaD